MSESTDLSWWTEENNEWVLNYLDKELDRVRSIPKELRENRIRVTCVRCTKTVIEVVRLTLPDDAQTRIYAIKFRRFVRLPLDVDYSLPPGELAPAMVKAREIQEPSYRLSPAAERPAYRLEGDGWGLIDAGHDCVDPNGRQFSAVSQIRGEKVLSGEIAAVDPWLLEWKEADTP